MVGETYDHEETRCPQLGHLVSFAYCRALGDWPCRRVVACWSERFDVQAHLATRYSQEEIASFLAPPPDKITQILELVEKARQRGGA